MRTCAACGSLVPEPEARFCGTCGAPVPPAAQPATIDPAPGASTVQARKPGETTSFYRPVSRPTDSVASTLSPSTIAADPGGLAQVTIRARNTGTVVDELRISVEGPIAGWAEVETPVLRLMPGTDGTSAIRLRPPLVPLALAGPQPFVVRVTSRQHPEEVATETGVLTVGDVRSLSATIVPATAKSSGSASYEVRVENKGNREVGVALVASDPDEALRLDLDATANAIPPGATLRARLKATPRSGISLGPAERRSFQVDVMSEGVAAASAGATLVQTARFPGWAPVAAAIAGGVAVLAIAGFALGFLPPGGGASPSAQAVLGSGGPSAPVTEPPSQEAVSAGAGEPTPTPSEATPSEEPTPTPTEEPPTPTPTARPDLCADGYLWRQIRKRDHVCVTQATVDQARFDDSQAESRWEPGTSDPPLCIVGFVWREAFEGDFVCVTGDVRTMTALDNERGPFRLATRTDTCLPEFVWREALAEDHVCVEPWVRDQAINDNVAAPTRWIDTSFTCASGFVWRIVVPTDLVCVFPEVRDQAAADNALAPSRMATP